MHWCLFLTFVQWYFTVKGYSRIAPWIRRLRLTRFIPEFALQLTDLIAIDICLDLHYATAIVRLLYIETEKPTCIICECELSNSSLLHA